MSTSRDQGDVARSETNNREDDVDEMEEESFPASDPPASPPGDER